MEENERSQARPQRRGAAPEASENNRLDGTIASGRKLLDQLESIIKEAKQIPVVKARLIPESDFDDLMGQLRMIMPDMVRDAAEILDQRDSILNAARSEAGKLRDDADKYSRDLRASANDYSTQTHAEADKYRTDLMQHAQDDAKAMIADAGTRAQQIVDSANQHAAGLVEENEITRRAQAYALEIRDSAHQQANAIYEQARKQTDLLLSGAAGSLSRSANELAKLRDSLLSGNQTENNI